MRVIGDRLFRCRR